MGSARSFIREVVEEKMNITDIPMRIAMSGDTFLNLDTRSMTAIGMSDMMKALATMDDLYDSPGIRHAP